MMQDNRACRRWGLGWGVLVALIGCALQVVAAPGRSEASDRVQAWTTTLDLSQRLEPSLVSWGASSTDKNSVVTGATGRLIEVDRRQRFQAILGMGGSLDHSTCSNLFRVPAETREAAIRRLMHPEHGIGMNLMRLCIGTSDFAGEDWYSYSDLPPGQTDPELAHFSIERDRAYILPCAKEVLRQNPKALFFASPWSPPGWMKTTGSMIGGELKREWYAVYALYFVKFLQAYEREGIPVYAVTVQNEPGVDRALEKDPKWYYPSCRWTGEQERDFIRDHLGPALKRAGLKTRIWCYDHNYNEQTKGDSPGLPYPRTILSDPKAARFVGGVGFHHYEGEPSGMSLFHREFPKIPLHLSEGSVFGIYGAADLMERLRHWSSSYNAWVMILDEKGRPNNGPFPATHAILKLHSDTLRMEELFEFYSYGHFMKFIRRGAVQIGVSAGSKELRHIAFENPDRSLVFVIVNLGTDREPIHVSDRGRAFGTVVAPKSVVTFQWSK